MADILIRGMEMPEYCYECPCHNGESGYCQAYKSGYLYSIERPAKCPLVSIPAGHGRLIDADKIPYVDSDDGCLDDYAFAYDIREMPTIVPSEGGTDNG